MVGVWIVKQRHVIEIKPKSLPMSPFVFASAFVSVRTKIHSPNANAMVDISWWVVGCRSRDINDEIRMGLLIRIHRRVVL